MLEKPYSCLNGQYLRAHRAAVAVSDRGFRFGDGVFETIRLESGVPYQWETHLARLAAGLAALRIPAPEVDWADAARRLMRKNKSGDGFLRLAVSRGAGSRGYLPHPPAMPATWLIEQLPPLPAPDAPCRLWLSARPRVPLPCLPVNAKLAQGVGSTLALMEAQDHACDEALQLTTSGLLCETASANLFWIQGGIVFTPSLDTGCLAGTTREALLRLSPAPTRMVAEEIAALESAEAVFVSNTRLGIWPVSSLQPMGWTWPTRHPLLAQLQQALTQDRADYTHNNHAAWQRK